MCSHPNTAAHYDGGPGISFDAVAVDLDRVPTIDHDSGDVVAIEITTGHAQVVAGGVLLSQATTLSEEV